LRSERLVADAAPRDRLPDAVFRRELEVGCPN
jgi:hypothetical protein